MAKMVVNEKEAGLLFYDWGRILDDKLHKRLKAAGFRFKADKPLTLERPWHCHARGEGHFELEQDG